MRTGIVYALYDVRYPGDYRYVGKTMEGTRRRLWRQRHTLDDAKRDIDKERARANQTPLEWRDEFAGSCANDLHLSYTIVPIEVVP